MKYRWVWVLVAVILVGSAAGYYFLGPNSRGQAAPESLKQGEARTSEEKLRLQIEMAVSGLGAELKQALPTYDGWLVGAEFIGHQVDLETTLENARKVFGELSRIDTSLAEMVAVFRTDELRDVYGNPLKDVVIARIGLDGTTSEKVNWQGFESLNFARIAGDFWLHDELQKQWGELERKLNQETEGGHGGSKEGGQGDQGGGGNENQPSETGVG